MEQKLNTQAYPYLPTNQARTPADLCCDGQVGLYALHGPLVNVGYGRPDAAGPDEFGGVGSNTNDQRDYPADQIISEWGKAALAACSPDNPASRDVWQSRSSLATKILSKLR